MKRKIVCALWAVLALVCGQATAARAETKPAAMGAAQATAVVTLYGHVTDAGSAEALFYSSVALEGEAITNVSNSQGFFSFKIPAGSEGNIVVSHQGYSPMAIPISSFAGHGESNPLEIKLVPISIRLDPAFVRDIDPKVLLEAAYRSVRDNYPQQRRGLTAFYREIGRKGSSKYVFLNEAVIDIDKAPYIGWGSDRMGIYKGRGTRNYDVTDTVVVKLQGGVRSTMDLDIVKYPFVGLPLDEALNTYTLKLTGITSHDGMLFYEVQFEPAENEKQILYRGKVYIETESLAIGRTEFSMAIDGREQQAAAKFVLKRSAKTRYLAHRANYTVNYRRFEDGWYYDYCRAEFQLSTRRRRSLFKTYFTITEEMAVTGHKTGDFSIEKDNQVKFKDVLSEKVSDFRDDAFWGDYNIIEPDQSIEVIIRKIIRQLGR